MALQENNPFAVASPAAAANPYAAPRAAVAAADDVAGAAPASRYQRLRAAIIDILIYAVAFLPMAILPGRGGIGMAVAGLAVLGIVGWNALLLARNGQTIGKKSVGIRIVRSDGSDAAFLRLFLLRGFLIWVLSWLPYIGQLFSLVNVLFIFRADRRCIHDLIADTRVVEAE